MKNCFMWKHHGHTVPCHFGCTDVCQIGLAKSRGGGPFLENFVSSLNPVAWYRYGAGITAAGGLVSAWADQSGNGNHLVQATETNQPALQADGSILFDGSDNYMQVTFTLDQPYTVYCLFRSLSFTANDRVFDGVTATARVVQGAASPTLTMNAGVSIAHPDGGLPVDIYGVIGCVFNGASSVFQINTLSRSGNAGANNPGGFTLAASSGVAAAFGHIQVKEVIIFPAAHDAGQRSKVISYLAGVGNLII